MPLQVVVTGGGPPSSLVLGDRAVVIGSSEEADLRLPTLDPRHLRLVPTRDGCWAAFARPSAPLEINSQPRRRGAVRAGDRLVLGGSIHLTIRATEPYLKVTNGLDAGARHLLGRGLTLGRSVSADVLLLDLACSREHCRVERRGAEFVVTDLGSINGTWLDGSRLVPGRAYPFRLGARLTMGEVEMELATGDDGATEDTALVRTSSFSESPTERIERPISEEPDLTGDLERLSFAQVVQLLSTAGKSGDLVVDGAKQGGIRFHQGRVDDAWGAGGDPEESFFALAGLREGSFSFRQRPTPASGRISRQTLALLLEAADREPA